MSNREPFDTSPTAAPSPTPVMGALWGWFRLLTGTAAQVYLVLMATLAVIAVLPVAFGWHSTVILTGSMEPHITAGDVITLSTLPGGQPVPLGHVVQFTSPAQAQSDGVERLILHRVVTDNEDGTYTTAGDANADVDSTPLTREQITGQARLLVPFIGLPALWLGTGQHLRLGLWAAATIAALLATLTVLVPQTRTDDPDDDPDNAPGYDPAALQDTEKIPVLARRGALAVAGAAVLAGMVNLPAPPSTAAFTARTSTRASWAVAAAPVPLTLGRAGPYGLLAAAAAINQTPGGHETTVNASVGTSPGTNIVAFQNTGARPNVTGQVEPGTPAAAAAMTDARTLEGALNSRAVTASRAATLSGVITPGVYTSTTGAFHIPTTLTLDARGNPAALFIFRATSLTAALNSQILLTGAAKAANVYWVMTGNVTLATNTTSRGTFLARGSITANLNSGGPTQRLTLEGRFISLGAGTSGGVIELNRPTITLPTA
ncbi:signal peptidase I [Kocuria sabuli]|uniref:signal peptidase I n=1 Tax=Kocuria sabuli TaxID=3071448 RepID=UPI0034D402D1